MTVTHRRADLDAAMHDLATGNRRDQPAVIDPTGQITFAGLARDVRRISGVVQDSDRHPAGRPVALPATAHRACLVTALGVMLAGCAPLLVPPRLLSRTRDHLRHRGHPHARTCDPWRATVSANTGQRRIWVTHGESPTARRKPDALGIAPGGTCLLGSPLHLAGPFEYAIRQLLIGGTVVLAAPFTTGTWLKLARTWRPSWVFATPTQLQRLRHEAPPAELAAALAPVTRLVHSSQPCPDDLHRYLVRMLGPGRLRQYYGTLQYDGILASATTTNTRGRPIAGAQLRIVDDGGGPMPPGEVGVIEGRTAGVITHPLDEPCPPPGTWTTVGDQGRITADGQLELISTAVPGRVVVGGVKVSLDHVRDVLQRHPRIAACDVRTEPDQRYGHVVIAHVTPLDSRVTQEAVTRHCVRHLEAAERPRQITIAPTPPTPPSASGERP